jgi:hypothetical protein
MAFRTHAHLDLRPSALPCRDGTQAAPMADSDCTRSHPYNSFHSFPQVAKPSTASDFTAGWRKTLKGLHLGVAVRSQ